MIGEEKKVFTLDELLSTALNANPSMAIFKANLEASRGEALEAFAYPNPEVDHQRWRGKSIETGEPKGQYSIRLGQPIDLPSKSIFRKKAAFSGVEVSQKELDDFHLDLRAELKTAFFRLL